MLQGGEGVAEGSRGASGTRRGSLGETLRREASCPVLGAPWAQCSRRPGGKVQREVGAARTEPQRARASSGFSLKGGGALLEHCALVDKQVCPLG